MMQKIRLNPDRVVKYIIYLNAALFIASLVLSGRQVELSIKNPFTAFSPSVNALIFMGAAGTIPIDRYHEWWSLIAANWLHGSLVHIIFNMTALLQIGPLIIREYGLSRMITIYTLGGAAGFFLSYLAGVTVTIGASAAICALIGAALYFGKSRGGLWGQMVYKQTSGWVLGLALIGLMMPNINNWGHGGGVVAGIALGWLLGYNEKSRENLVHGLVAGTLVVLTLGVLAWSLLSATLLSF
ncbi:MAG: rhomboid family intramembrane serine protease [Desulfobacteraceae bacterium]|nr:rhomboid family intramembrane serine protease [Desulfobacteraceae bacterium]